MTSAATPRALTVLAALLEARTGQQIASYRTWRIDTALAPLLRERGLATLDDLALKLLDGQDRLLGDRIVEALVNGESSFFRDQLVFEQIGGATLAHESQGRRVRIWSAGCATGQEPLSLAMTFAERDGAAIPPEIVATDVSEASLARARAGRYTQFEVQRGLPIRRLMRWFEGDAGGEWIADAALTRMIQYRRMNLVADRPPAGQFDVVLCRNVLIYLSAPLKEQVFATIAGALRPGGTLFLGAGETVIGQSGLFEPSRRFRGAYDRIEAAATRAA
jgi:chemotaxis protein methyltransferase CheR